MSDIFNFSISVSSLLEAVFHLWPALLIVVGINIIFKKSVVKIIALIAFFIILAVYITAGSMPYGTGWLFDSADFDRHEKINPCDYTVSKTINKEEGMLEGIIDIDMGACFLDIKGTDDAAAVINSNIEGVKTEDGFENHKLYFKIREDKIFDDIFKSGRKTDIELNKNIAWEIRIDTGASGICLNMRDLSVSRIMLDIGAGSGEIIFGEKSKISKALIKGGAANLKIYAPKNSGIKIETNSGSVSSNFEKSGLKKIKDVYITDNYENAENLLDIDLKLGASNVELVFE